MGKHQKRGKFRKFSVILYILFFKINIESVLPTFQLATLILNMFEKHNVPCAVILKYYLLYLQTRMV